MKLLKMFCCAVSLSAALYTAGGVFQSVSYAEENPSSGSYIIPEMTEAEMNHEAAEGTGKVKIDLSSTDKGYVAVSAESSRRLKFQVITGETTYNYDLRSDGTPAIFPLQSGDGEYRFRVMENTTASRYAELYSTSKKVSLESEFAPFLVNSDYVPYSADSGCVGKARGLAEKCTDTVSVIRNIYGYICDSVTYDYEKAKSVRSGYLSDPDSTMNSGKGICFDYSALAAAMLRSLGIPTKMIFGYVAPDGVYHAWNMIYSAERGWIAADLAVSGDSWARVDLTFAANGADGSFIGNGENYADVYTY